jgi:RND superfamily putative drug exporter
MTLVPTTRSIAGASTRHPWRVIGFWVLMLVLAGVLQAGVGTRFNDNGDFTNNPESKQADALLNRHMNADPSSETIVVKSTQWTVDDPAFQTVVQTTAANLAAMPGVVASVADYYQVAQAGSPDAGQMVSADRHVTLLDVTLAGQADDLADQGAAFVKTAQGQSGNGFEVYAVGDLSGNEAYNTIANEDLAKSEKVGLPVALLVLIVVFAALVAPALPLLLGLISIFVAVGLTVVVSRFVSITSEVTIMISMIGLAVGIDYALFMVERYREERRWGAPKQLAIELAGATAGKAILFSGGTVILALLGMFILPITVFHSLASGAILAVLVAVLATQTFIPALLGLLGDKINFPRRTKSAVAATARTETIHRGFWGGLTRLVMAKPLVSLVFAVAILLVAAFPALSLKTGTPGLDVLPPSDVKTGYLIMNDEFYAGLVAPVQIVIDGKSDEPWVQTGIANLKDALAGNALYGPLAVTPSDDGAVTVVSVPLGADPESPRSYDAITDLRKHTIPAAFGANSHNVFVGGDSASNVDFNTVLADYTPRVFAFVLGLSFLLLMLAFRSLVVPAKAIVMNLLSVGAAYGVLVAVFQKGIGAGLLGVQRTETIGAWIPIFLFCVLFGLSMDYHVFLLSRIREHYDLTHRNEESVAVGLQATGKIITGAALIMVAVFGAFASGRINEIQQMGLGLAVAVFLDATVVRSILVPAAMKLLGDRNWYLPKWLTWLPDLRIEGAREAITLLGATAPAD